MTPSRRQIGFLVVLGLLVAGAVAFFTALPGGEPKEAMSRLVPGRPAEGSIDLEPQSYLVTAAAGDFLEVALEQRGVDLTVSLLDEAGRSLVVTDGPGLEDTGTEILPAVVEAAGTYQVEIRPTSRYGKPGSYVARLAVRLPSPQDRSRAMAAKELTRARLFEENEAFPDAFSALERALRHAQGSRQLAEVLHRQGLLLYKTSKHELARDVLDRAGEEYLAHGNLLGQAHALHASGSPRYYLGDFAGALEARQKAYDLYKKIGGVMGRLGRADVCRSRAVVHFNRGEYDLAQASYEEALSIWPSGIEEPGRVQVLNDLGALYLDMADPEQARRTHLQALQRIEAVQEDASLACDKARALGGLGQSFTNEGKMAEAIPYLQWALGQSKRCRDVDVFLPVMNRIGSLYLSPSSNRLQRYIARRAYEWSLDRADPTRHQLDMANTLTGLAALELRGGRPEEAVALFNRALALRLDREYLLGIQGALYGRALAERELGNLTAAQSSIRDSLAAIEELRRQPLEDTRRAELFSSRRLNYDLSISILMEQHKAAPTAGFAEDAFEVNEQARARTLMDWLGSDQLADTKSPLVSDRERKLNQDLRTAWRELSQLRGISEESRTPEVEKQIEEQNRVYKDLELELEEIQADSRVLDLEKSKPLTLAEIREQVLDEQTLLLAYWFGDRGEPSYLWAVDQTSITVHFFSPEEKERIEALAEEVYLGLSDREARPRETVRDLAALSRLILSPVAPLLEDHRLLVVADGGLQSLPFPALQDPRAVLAPDQRGWSGYQPLAARHTVVMLPSASMLGVLRQELEGRDLPPKKLALIADPVFNFEDGRAQKAKMEGTERSGGLDALLEDLDRLENTAAEAEAILDLVEDPEERFIAVGFDANRDTVLNSGLGQYQIVHFATHGIYDRDLALSGLALSGVRHSGLERNWFLPAFEISRMDLPVELVVLSACETALGKVVAGEGVFNLSRAFFYAGARRVVVTHWKVDDEATAQFMKFFYEGILVKDLDLSKALQEAQKKMRQRPEWEHPYYWGGFVLQGEW